MFVLGFGEHNRIRDVVDVFASATEVHVFFGDTEPVVEFQLFFDVVLHSLHIVIRDCLDFLDSLALLDREFADNAVEIVSIREGRYQYRLARSRTLCRCQDEPSSD